MATSRLTFSASVAGFAKRVPEAIESVFREAAHELVIQLDNQLDSMIYETPQSEGYKRTRFLQASLVASQSAMPTLNRKNPGTPVSPDLGEVLLVVDGADVGETLYLGYTAEYGAYVHYGSSGAAPRPWVNLVAQRWQEIVEAKVKKAKTEFGL
jgi:hypothetical protein